MKNGLTMQTFNIMKNYSKYICLFLLLLGTGTHAWGNTTVTLSSFGSDTDCTESWCDGGSFTDNGSNTWTADGYLVSSGKLAIGKGGANFLQTPDFGDDEIKSITVTWYGNTDFYLALQTTDGTELEAIQNPSNASADPATRTFTVSSGYAQLKLVGRRASGTSNARATISSVVLVYGPPCDKSVTITKGTGTNCTFDLSVSGAQASCNGVSTTVTVSPTTGYGTPVVTESGASAEPTISGSGNTWTVAYGENTTSTSTINVSCSANNYTVTLNDNSGSGGSGSKTVTFNASTNLTTSVAVPTKTGYTFDGYWTSSDEGSSFTTQLVDEDGAWIASVSGYTDGSKNWKYAGDLILYAKWTLNSHTLAIASVANVEISATTPELDEGESTSVNYGATVTLSHETPDGGRQWGGWNVYKTGDASTTIMVNGDNQFTMPDHNVTVSANLYSDLVFSCAELTLTPHLVTVSTPIFITSTANKKVRSQDYITITGDGLTPSTALTFPGLPNKFEVLTSTGGAISTDVNGAINVNAYIFYTPAADATTDGLDKIAGITVSVGGTKPKQASLVQEIIGRHLPAEFVIAGKKNNKWYALPATMSSTDHPAPVEIAVDDIDNPSIAYTATGNVYGLVGPTTGASSNISNGDGQYVKLTMHPLSDAPLFGQAPTNTAIGKSGDAIATNNLSAGWWWQLKQTNTSITNPQDAKYTIYCANNTSSLSIKDNAGNPEWGLYASGVEELRLIPASDIVFTEAYFVEWAQHGGVVEVDATGIDATSVVAHLGEATSSAITLSQTGTSVKGSATKYNYTVNFGEGIDFAAATSNGALLRLEWKNGETVKAMSNIVVPKIIATSATMSSINSGDDPWLQMEVHVLPGVTLTANAGDFLSNDVVINHLEIYPGATVEVTKGAAASGTLKVKTLVLRNGWTRAGEKAYDVARLYITPSTASLVKNAVGDVWYSDWYIDYDQYYPVAVPWKVTLATGLQYRYTKVSPTYGYDKNIRLLYYDGEGRAKGTNGSAGDGANWRFYGAPGGKAMPATLDPSKAYAMTAKRPTGKAFSIIRMTMNIPSAAWTASGEQGNVTVEGVTTHKNTVNVVAYNNDQGNAAEYAKGWNFIANPYMSLYQGQIGYTEGKETVRFVNIPDEKFKEYDQQLTLTAKLKPASGVLIQAPETGRLIFGTANRKLSMPSFYSETQKEQIPEQQVVVVLSDETNEDMMGLLVSDKYTAEYEINADLEKLLSDGNTLRTYMRYGDMNMAYVAINETLAKEWIPVSVRIPADGEYTFSLHEASIAGELEGVYLIDYQNGDKITNLIEQSYTFSSTAGTINGRFAINAKVGERQTPTGIDAINAGGDINSDKPFKFIYHDKVYIWLNGVIYDTIGKRVK